MDMQQEQPKVLDRYPPERKRITPLAAAIRAAHDRLRAICAD